MDALRFSVPVWNSCEGVAELDAGVHRLVAALRHGTVQRLPAFAHVLHFGGVVGRPVERRVGDIVIRNRNAEAGAEGPHFVVVQLLLVVGDVLAFTRLADAIALDGAREHHGRHALGLDRAAERVEHLVRIVSAEGELLELLVREVLDHLEEARVGAPEVLAGVGAGFHGVLLVLAVHHFAHALDEQAVGVLLEQRVPFGAPDALDHVPAGAAEDGLQLLDDLAVAAHRAVEPLQVAVDDEDQVVELLARRQRDGAQRLGFVGLAVAEECPHLGVGLRLQAAIFQVAVEPRLVDGHDRPESHRHRGELPEVGHQPGVRIRREAAARLQLAAEVLELLDRQASFEKRAGVDARRAVTLEVDDVGFVAVLAAAEEVVVAHFVERRGGGERRDVAANTVFVAVGAHDHGHRVPAHEALDPSLDFPAAGIRDFVGGMNGVDVGSIRGERELHAGPLSLDAQVTEQAAHTGRPAMAEHIVERIEPFPGFEGFQLGGVCRSSISHSRI